MTSAAALHPQVASLPPAVVVQSGRERPENERKVIFWSLVGVAGLTVATGTFLLMRHGFRKVRQRKAFHQTLDEGSPEAFANRIQMAFDNDGYWGTDMQALRKVFLDIPHVAFYKKVASEFQKLSKGDVLEDKLKGELKTQQWNELSAILNAKPGREGETSSFNALSIAKRINAALNESWGFIPGTDDHALKVALSEIPSQAKWDQVAEAYQSEFTSSMGDDLDSDHSWWEHANSWFSSDFLDWREVKENLPLAGLHPSFLQVWDSLQAERHDQP